MIPWMGIKVERRRHFFHSKQNNEDTVVDPPIQSNSKSNIGNNYTIIVTY